MASKRTRGLLAGMTAGLLAPTLSLVWAAAQAGPAAAASFSAGSAGHPAISLFHFDGGGLNVPVEGARRRVIAFNSWESGLAQAVKAADPATIVVEYKDLSSTRDYACTGGVDDASLPTGVGYCYANSAHPEWFLTDAAGHRLTYGGYSGHWQMNVAVPSYQQAWTANVVADAKAHGWDGVIMDNAITKADSYHSGVVSPAYPTDAATQAAYRSMLSTATAALRANGLLSVANISDAYEFPGLWADWLTLLDGASQEHFANWSNSVGTGYVWDWGQGGWKSMIDEVATTAAMGKISLVTGGGVSTDPDALNYTLASYLLVADGRSTFSFGDTTPWFPQYDYDLGTPSGAYTSLGNSTYERNFSAGTVIVNASSTVPATVNLGGSFLDESGATVSSVTLAPTRGVILRSAGGGGGAPGPAGAGPAAPGAGPAGPGASAASATGSAPVGGAGTGSPSSGGAPGFRLVTQAGGVASFGNAAFDGSLAGSPLSAPVVGGAARPRANGYWLLGQDGGVFSFGQAPFFGSTGAMHLNNPVVGMAATPTGNGYWFVASDGGIFSFGDAGFFGSTGAIHLNAPIVGMTSTPTGKGYWLVASDGGIFSFGDARFFGSTGAIHLNAPIVGMTSTPAGKGYRFVASDGGIFSFGDARFFGSVAGSSAAPVKAMAATPSGNGYWLAAANGSVFCFGDATLPPATGDATSAPVVSIAA